METRYRRQQRYALTTTRFFGAEGPARVPTQRVSPFAERARGNVTDAVTANCSSISLPRLAYTHSSVIGTAILPTRLQLAVRNHHDQLRYTSFLAPSPSRSSLDSCKTLSLKSSSLQHPRPASSCHTTYPLVALHRTPRRVFSLQARSTAATLPRRVVVSIPISDVRWIYIRNPGAFAIRQRPIF